MPVEPLYLRAQLEEGVSGDWRLERFAVSPSRVGAEDDPRPAWARCPPGQYLRLSVGSVVMMTDTFEEWSSQRPGMARACRDGGRVLVSGLGLGVVVDSMLRTPGSRVEHVTVIEASQDVIRLVGPSLEARHGDQLEIVHHDAFTWTPAAGSRYTVGWHDIWPNPYDPGVPAEMDRLEAHYAACCGWQGCWAREIADGTIEQTDYLAG